MKKYKLSIQILLTGALALSVISGCKKDYLDINDNPNSPADAGVQQLLPYAQASIGHAVGNNIQILADCGGSTGRKVLPPLNLKPLSNTVPEQMILTVPGRHCTAM